jgi:predicted GNAT family N-acyltransferase
VGSGMKTQAFQVHIIACIKDSVLREHWQSILAEVAERIAAEGSTFPSCAGVFHENSLESADTRCEAVLGQRGTAVILLSDALLNPDDEWRPQWRTSSAGKELRLTYSHKLYVSVAIDDRDERVADIDLVVPRACESKRLLEGLRLLGERLRYYAPPSANRPPWKELGIEPRPIRSQTEMYEAFRLRHEVYRTMGYLESASADSEVGMEIDYCDLYSNHYGAFVPKPGGGEELVGLARLILVSGSGTQFRDWTHCIVSRSDALRKSVCRDRQRYAQFKLPIFSTLPLNSEIGQAFTGSDPWGELSRVIVAPAWRGSKIAKGLVERVLEDADALKTSVVLLECLDIHQQLYEGLKFASLYQRGEVPGIGKTMIGMRRNLPISSSEPTQHVEADLQVEVVDREARKPGDLAGVA